MRSIAATLVVAAGAATLSETSRAVELEQLLVKAKQLKKEGWTGTVAEFASETIDNIVSDARPAIEAEHTADQALIDATFAMFGSIRDTYNTHLAEVETLLEQFGTHKDSHNVCRSQEEDLCREWTICHNELIRRWGLVITEETNLVTIHETIKARYCPDPSEPTPNQRGNFPDGHNSFREVSLTQFHSYIVQKPIVYEMWESWHEQYPICVAIAEQLDSKKDECDNKQTETDLGACKHATELHQMKTDLDTAWAKANEAWADALANVRLNEGHRKTEWEALETIKCVLETIHDEGQNGENPCDEDINDPCDDITHNTTGLNINYPTIPDPPSPPDMPPLACTAEYQDAHYLESYRLHGDSWCRAAQPCLPCTLPEEE